MIIGSVSENKNTEKRISVTPENVKKFITNGFKVYLEKNYGTHLDIDDKKFSENGAEFFSDKYKILKNSDGIIDISDAFSQTDPLSYIDGIHYSPSGNRIIAERVYDIIKDDLL